MAGTDQIYRRNTQQRLPLPALPAAVTSLPATTANVKPARQGDGAAAGSLLAEGPPLLPPPLAAPGAAQPPPARRGSRTDSDRARRGGGWDPNSYRYGPCGFPSGDRRLRMDGRRIQSRAGAIGAAQWHGGAAPAGLGSPVPGDLLCPGLRQPRSRFLFAGGGERDGFGVPRGGESAAAALSEWGS